MGFVPITIDKYIAIHLANNPSEQGVDLRKNLHAAIDANNKGVKCPCGNDIWVVCSASVGISCFTCITGERDPKDAYQIDTLLKKSVNKKGRRHLDDIDPANIAGFFDDQGYEINLDLIKKPTMCLICKNNYDPDEEILCNLTRLDQQLNAEFRCFAFRKK